MVTGIASITYNIYNTFLGHEDVITWILGLKWDSKHILMSPDVRREKHPHIYI